MTQIQPLFPEPDLPLELQPDEVLLALVGYCEARNQINKASLLGPYATQCVALNRCRHSNKTVSAIVTESAVVRGRRVWQFSFWSRDDPRTPYLEPTDPAYAAMLRLQLEHVDSTGSYQTCWLLAVGLLSKVFTSDPTHGALNYYNPMVAQPSWGRGNPRWHEHAVIGDHVFGTAA
jgi:hypothetical protein